MRILHLVSDLRDSGNGIVNAAIDVATYQSALGHQVAVAAGNGEFVHLLEKHNVTWFSLPLERSVRNMLQAAPGLQKIIWAFKPDVVHAHTIGALIIGFTGRISRRFQLIASAHRVYDREAKLLKLADKVIALGKENSKHLEALGVERLRIRIVMNGTIGSFRRSSNAYANPVLQKPFIVSVAGLYRRKGIDTLIDAFTLVAQQNDQVHLYLVGGGERDDFEKYAQNTTFADRIHFTGFCAQPEVYMKEAEVFVLASRREAFPLALIEAREAGCAIISTDVDGAREALDDGRAGLLVPPSDPAAMAEALRNVINDKPLRNSYRVATQTGLDAFTAKRMAAETLRVYTT